MDFGVKINTPNGIALNISSQIGQFADSMTLAINPQLVKSEGRGDRNALIKLMYNSTKFTLFIFSILVAPLIIELPYLLKLWLKIVPDFTIIFCNLILINSLIEKSTFEITNAIRAVGDIKWFQITETLIRLLILPITYVLFKLGFPPITIYVVSLVISLFIILERFYFGKKILGISILDYFKYAISPPIIIFIFNIIICSFLKIQLSVGFDRFIFILIFSSIFSSITFWFFGISLNEKQVIKLTIKNYLN